MSQQDHAQLGLMLIQETILAQVVRMVVLAAQVQSHVVVVVEDLLCQGICAQITLVLGAVYHALVYRVNVLPAILDNI